MIRFVFRNIRLPLLQGRISRKNIPSVGTRDLTQDRTVSRMKNQQEEVPLGQDLH